MDTAFGRWIIRQLSEICLVFEKAVGRTMAVITVWLGVGIFFYELELGIIELIISTEAWSVWVEEIDMLTKLILLSGLWALPFALTMAVMKRVTEEMKHHEGEWK